MNILIIDDDPVFSDTLARTLQRWGNKAVAVNSPQAAHATIKAQQFDVAILDLRLGDHNGLALIKPLLRHNSELRILVLTGYASITTAIDAIKRGAYNYLPKPATARMILAALEAEATSDSLPEVNDPISLRRLEWEHIQRLLEENDHNISATARALGMHRRTLQRKLAKKPSPR